jgi:hypothetical protein
MPELRDEFAREDDEDDPERHHHAEVEGGQNPAAGKKHLLDCDFQPGLEFAIASTSDEGLESLDSRVAGQISRSMARKP